MSVFVRRFTFDPGNEILLNIESVNILDLEPPSSISGIGTGTVLMVGEFEDGPFNTVTEVSGAQDLISNFGGFGFTIGSVPSNYPCAVARKADSAPVAENWNGNGVIQLNGKQYARLILCRADTSVGTVQFTPCAYITGGASFRYSLANSQVLSLNAGAGYTSATFTATAGTVTSGSQTFPTSFAGGETLTLGYDGAANFTVTFLAGDTTQAAIIARINQYAGFAMAAVVSGTTTSLTGLQKGNQAQIRVVAGSSGVLTALALTAATTFGTGNVADITAVTPNEIASVVKLAIANTNVEVNANGALRITNTLGTATSFIQVGPATTATALGFTPGQVGTQLGVATVVGVAGSFTLANTGTILFSYDNAAPVSVTVTTGDSLAATVTNFNTAAGVTIAYQDNGQLRLIGKAPGGKIQIISASAGNVLSQLGIAIGTYNGVALPVGSIPAGTVVQTTDATKVFVTMQSINFGSAGVSIGGNLISTLGPYSVKIRHAVDDGTGVLAGAGTVIAIPNAISLASFTVLNPQATTAALTDPQIDAQYVTACNSTLDINSVAREANIIIAARQSNVMRQTLRNNAITASVSLFGRDAVIRPPLGTTRAAALSTVAQPGVGAYRNQRAFYCYPGCNTFVPGIASRGVSGGAGFTASGNVDIGSDSLLASILSQLPPEENPGQLTAFTTGINGIETSANAQGFLIEDYELFKAAGICALRMDDGVAIFQSGVTSVDPLVNSSLVRISRRRMADFIQDTLGKNLKQFGKRLSTNVRRQAMVAEIRSFMDTLLAVNNPGSQRIAGYTVDAISGNTLDTLGQGMFRIILKVRTLASLDSIVIQSTVGEQVVVQEVLPAAA